MSSSTDKAIQLFTYLKDLCALRATQVRDFAKYEEVLWFYDIPKEKYCHCIAWRFGDNSEPSAVDRPDVWVEIRKPLLKSPPEEPDDLEQWLKDDITDSSIEEPDLFTEIPVTVEPDESSLQTYTEVLSLDDHPDIFELWVDYVEKKWKPWAEEDRRLQRVQTAYNQLFNIYQRQEKLGEQYEVIVGTGLLSWQSPSSSTIRRHMVSLQAHIEFDRLRGIMTVRPALDGSQPTFECEMLETSDRPEVADMRAVEDAVNELRGDPWSGPQMEATLRMLANVLSTNSRYDNTLDRQRLTSDFPVVSFSPALVMRRRTRRTFVSFYQQIIEQLQVNGDLPINVRSIVEIVEDDNNDEQKDSLPDGEPHVRQHPDDIEVYFPSPSNSQQKLIAQRVHQRRGVLVQGPPGTGKSHTIANLIAHFLATGNRVLVTSETPRALNVLKAMLPEEIAELCVVWLGSGPESQRSLEQSVRGITQRKIQWDQVEEKQTIVQLRESLHSERQVQAKLRHDLCACRESDTYRHTEVFGRYSGTLQQIAIEINAERQHYRWFLDRPSEMADPVVSGNELTFFLHLHRKLTAEHVKEMNHELVFIDKLLEPNAFQALVEDERVAGEKYHLTHKNRFYPGYENLLKWDPEDRSDLFQLLKHLLALLEGLSRHYHGFAARAAREIAADQDRVWRELLQVTEDHIAGLSKSSRMLSSLQITGIQERDQHVVAADARSLKAHIDAGKGLRFRPFRTGVVKQAIYLVNTVRVDGQTCNNSDTLQLLIDWLEMGRTFHGLAEVWDPYIKPPTGTYMAKLAAYQDLCEPLYDALAVHDLIEKAKRRLTLTPELQLPVWHERSDIEALCAAIDAANVDARHRSAKRTFLPLLNYLQEIAEAPDSHPSSALLLRSVEERDIAAYSQILSKIIELHKAKQNYKTSCDILSRFRTCAPATCEAYEASILDNEWTKRFHRFADAWTWAKADKWIEKMCDEDTPKRLGRSLVQSQLAERDFLKNLAAYKAWQHCMTKLGEPQRMALIAWAQSVARIGRGTGKYAERHRETARQKLQECRRAIPAWVMPLYQVVQTIRPDPGIFDIVIIDEASQSGPEALFLNYIGKKLVVVGDDKQITPMHVGVNREHVDYLRRMHLGEIPHNESLDLEGSLFAQAELRFPDRISLREHFRCMPEIIQFSNNLSYSAEPLIPLRQYGAHRQKPVKTVHVENGYRKGTAGNVENRPEALAIVAKIAECCEDPEYLNDDNKPKSFGVISLLGHRQSSLIASLLVIEIGAEAMERRLIICGEPYDFQGDERDVIFLSMVDAPEDGRGCRMIRDAAAQRRFNVATSRARDQLWLFHSATLNDLRPECLRYRLLEYCLNPKTESSERVNIGFADLQRLAGDPSERQHNRPPSPFDSWFEVDVYLRIAARQYRVIPQFEVAGYRIDLIVEGLQGRMAVECDGDKWHGPDRYDADMARQRELERCGWGFFRVRGGAFYRDPEEALTTLWVTLETLGIFPQSEWKKQKAARGTTEPSPEEPESNRPNEESIDDDKPEDSVDSRDEEKPGISHSDDKEFHKPTDSDLVRGDLNGGRLENALKWSRSRQERPENLPPTTIQMAITAVLRDCPNYTCTLKSITARVLKHLEIRTRGNPRAEFEKRIRRNISAMKRKGWIEGYKAKNRRIRLLAEENSLFRSDS